MADLNGDATVFYSTHILDDVQRVSDHVAILDQRPPRARRTDGRAARSRSRRTACAWSSAGPTDATAIQLAALPGALSVEPAERDGDVRSYLSASGPRTRRASSARSPASPSDRDLTLIENGLVRLDLEDVFLRLIDPKERAA